VRKGGWEVKNARVATVMIKGVRGWNMYGGVHGPKVSELWPRNGLATGYTFFHRPPRRDPCFLSSISCACPISNGLPQTNRAKVVTPSQPWHGY